MVGGVGILPVALELAAVWRPCRQIHPAINQPELTTPNSVDVARYPENPLLTIRRRKDAKRKVTRYSQLLDDVER